MADSYHFYFGAAQALWNLSLDRLQTMSKEADHAAVRQAAERTLQLKARFMTPDEFTEERAAISKLAGALFADRDFTVDLALEVAGKPPGPEPTRGQSRPVGQPRSRRWKATLWVAVAAGSILLALDVMATAGVPVPTPIGELIERFSSDNPPYLPPQPLGDPDHLPPALFDRVTEARAETAVAARAGAARTQSHVRRFGASGKKSGKKSGKNVNHANGRDRHQAKGREQNQARGKDLYQANGTLRIPSKAKAVGRSVPPPKSTGRNKTGQNKTARKGHSRTK